MRGAGSGNPDGAVNATELRRILVGVGIDDILLSGFIDRGESPPRYHVSQRAYYLECGGLLLRFSTVSYTGRGLLAVVPQIYCALDLDDDMDFAVVSVKQMLLKEPDGTNLISRVRLWGTQDLPSGVECAAVRVDLANDQVLFFDPSYHFGIRVGGAEQQGIWADNAQGREAVSTELF